MDQKLIQDVQRCCGKLSQHKNGNDPINFKSDDIYGVKKQTHQISKRILKITLIFYL